MGINPCNITNQPNSLPTSKNKNKRWQIYGNPKPKNSLNPKQKSRVTVINEKNRLNNMSADYAKALRKKHLKETIQIETFLAEPENAELQALYESTVEEFNLKIIAKRKDYQSFDDILNYLLDLLFKRDPDLSKNRKLTRTMLFYMYWHCDIGETGDAETK